MCLVEHTHTMVVLHHGLYTEFFKLFYVLYLIISKGLNNYYTLGTLQG